VLGVSLLLFFLGQPMDGAREQPVILFGEVAGADPFILVFAIVFPAFTGMTAGVGLSGDLANPRRSIPLGILSATVVGMVAYVAVAWKLASSATLDVLADTGHLAMEPIAVWGPIIPIGLAAATISSAIGSILVAPRTLQALAADESVPVPWVNRFLAAGVGEANEPRNATLITAALAFLVVALGNIDLVAALISMFFMVTYGSLCAISFLEHFAARPSYRPSFRSKWYISLFGALMCVFLMFQMSPVYAIAAISVMLGLYIVIQRSRGAAQTDFGAIFHGVMTQATRYLQIRLQKAPPDEWRPSIITITPHTFDRSAPLQILSWMSFRYGFGTYLHYIPGMLTDENHLESRRVMHRLLRVAEQRPASVFMDTMVSPSMRSALAQTVQAPGIAGVDNNAILFEFSEHDPVDDLGQLVDGIRLGQTVRMDTFVLRHGDHHFGNRAEVHVWLTWHDYRNANLMILLGYILLGHPDWADAELRVFAAYPKGEMDVRTEELRVMMAEGRLPASPKNVEMIATDDRIDFSRLVETKSGDADLVILGFTRERLAQKGPDLLRRHPGLNEVLWVSGMEPVAME
jgi:hypothetical protein